MSCQSTLELTNNVKVKQNLQSLVDNIVSNQGADPIHNSLMMVKSPGIVWKGASGMADGLNEKMSIDHNFKIASITKTFTATIILQLLEEKKLNLNDTIDKYLDNKIINIDNLHIYKDTSYGRTITLADLLSHRSGLADYMEDPQFVQDVAAQGEKLWSPTLVLSRYYAYQTNLKAKFIPDNGYSYSDINYVILAMIIEEITQTSLSDEFNNRIFKVLNMNNSYLEFYGKPRGNKRLSHAFYSTYDLNTQLNTSFDWGGGGIVSNLDELDIFFRALLKGKLFKNKSTLDLMLNLAEKGNGNEYYTYGFGIMKREIAGINFYGHGGAYDCDVFYSPVEDISIIMSMNQMNTHGKRDKYVSDAISIIMTK